MPVSKSSRLTWKVEPVPADQYTDLVRAWLSKTQVRPGETVQIHFAAKDPDGQEEVHTLRYEVPVSMPRRHGRGHHRRRPSRRISRNGEACWADGKCAMLPTQFVS